MWYRHCWIRFFSHPLRILLFIFHLYGHWVVSLSWSFLWSPRLWYFCHLHMMQVTYHLGRSILHEPLIPMKLIQLDSYLLIPRFWLFYHGFQIQYIYHPVIYIHLILHQHVSLLLFEFLIVRWMLLSNYHKSWTLESCYRLRSTIRILLNINDN
jgi:hypothetical protein